MVNFSLNAQFTCASAQVITPGTQTVSEVISGQIPFPECAENYGGTRTAGRWYVFTASVDGIATVSSDLPSNSNTDTRFHVYTGDCTSLSCLGGNDDIDVTGNVKTSKDTFPISIGTSYYIAWDDRWSPNGFDFTLSETAVSCPDGTLPLVEDFEDSNSFFACYQTEDVDNNATAFKQQFVDLDGDGTDNVYLTNGSTSVNAKDDWLFSPAINFTSGNEYTINFKYNGADGSFPADENLEVLIMDSPSSTGTELASIFYQTGITLTGDFSQAEDMATNQSVTYQPTVSGTYYLAFNGTSAANTGSLLLFDYSITEEVLSTDKFNLDSVSHNYNAQTDILFLNANSLLANVKIYNVLGQNIQDRKLGSKSEQLDLSSLNNGIYFLKISTFDHESIVKLLKH